MPAKVHDTHQPGCPQCNPTADDPGAVCKCIETAFAEGLRRWQTACPCCFGDANPAGLDAALAAAMK